MSDELSIRPAATIADFRACQDAQRRAWGITAEEYVVPIATMVGAQLHGGLVLGAFDRGGTALGVSFAFLGRLDGRLCLYSQLTGVVPGAQGRGLGGRLKEAQRQFARAAGLELIAWAFDPLQSGNAHFNLGRLGARSHTYIKDMYGSRTDALNAGAPTDRLIVGWSTSDAPARLRSITDSELAGLPHVVDAASVDRAAIAVAAERGGLVLLEIPADIGRLRVEAPGEAVRWREAVAATFTTLFAAGFEAVDFVRVSAEGGPRSFYVLRLGRPGP
jgi:predicted GNAT superfamily acetyltransferase